MPAPARGVALVTCNRRHFPMEDLRVLTPRELQREPA